MVYTEVYNKKLVVMLVILYSKETYLTGEVKINPIEISESRKSFMQNLYAN